MTKIKLAMIGIAALLFANGCKLENTTPRIDDSQTYHGNTNVIFQIDFNDEIYIWEDFYFSTNRVIQAK